MGRAMRGTSLVMLFGAALLAFLAFALWYQQAHPRVITGTGQVSVDSRRPPFQTVVLKTRDVAVNGVAFKEIELPGGTWIDCAGDCRKAAREAREEFWDTQSVPRK
jgi:hypothetical protein